MNNIQKSITICKKKKLGLALQVHFETCIFSFKMRTELLSLTSVEKAFHSSTIVEANKDLYNSKRHERVQEIRVRVQ